MTYSLPKYFRVFPPYMVDEIITGMIEGKQEPTPEEMEDWLTSEREREAEILLAAHR